MLNKRSSAQGKCSAKSQVAYVTSYNYNYDSKLAFWALGALPYTDTIPQGGTKSTGGTKSMWGIKSGGGGQSQGEGDKFRGRGTKSGGGGTKWGQGHLVAKACTALPLGASP